MNDEAHDEKEELSTMETYTRLKDQYDRIFSKHRLDMVLNNDPFRAYMLRPPEGGRTNSVMVLFTPEGIVLSGDHAPGINGMVSNIGYGLDWFSDAKGAEYLCEKFGVEKVVVHAYALAFVREQILALETSGTATYRRMQEWEDLLDSIEHEVDAHDLYSTLRDLDVDEYYDVARGYEPNTMAKLTAIQHRFAELMGDLGKEEAMAVVEKNA